MARVTAMKALEIKIEKAQAMVSKNSHKQKTAPESRKNVRCWNLVGKSLENEDMVDIHPGRFYTKKWQFLAAYDMRQARLPSWPSGRLSGSEKNPLQNSDTK